MMAVEAGPAARDALLVLSDVQEAHERIGGFAPVRVILLADHASNAMPPAFAGLGLPDGQLARHIAYDIGIEALTRRLAALFGAPAVLTRFSRLLIDPIAAPMIRHGDADRGRGDHSRQCADRFCRIEERRRRFYEPYHAAIAD